MGLEFPTARFWSCHRRPSVRRRWPLFFLPNSLYYSHLFVVGVVLEKKKQKPARPRQRAPARKGYKIWTEPEKDALTAGVKKYGPGATHNTTYIRGSFPPPPLSKGNTPNVVIHSRRRSTALLFGGVSFSLFLAVVVVVL